MNRLRLTTQESSELRQVESGRYAFDFTIAVDRKCANCGYALRGHKVGEVCPECGRIIPPRDDVHFVWRHFVAFWLVAITVLGGYGCELTYQHSPATVSVSGYIRRDGTRVSSYHRRAPGVAARDRAVSNARWWIRAIIFVAWVGLIPVGVSIQGRIVPPPLKLQETPISRRSDSVRRPASSVSNRGRNRGRPPPGPDALWSLSRRDRDRIRVDQGTLPQDDVPLSQLSDWQRIADRLRALSDDEFRNFACMHCGWHPDERVTQRKREILIAAEGYRAQRDDAYCKYLASSLHATE